MIVEDKAFGDSEINFKKTCNGNDGNRLFIIKQVKGTRQITSKSSFPHPHVLRIDKMVQFMGSLHENVGK